MDVETVLKPCPVPWCGETEQISFIVSHWSGRACVECLNCKARSPWSDDKDRAIAAWNNRPTVDAPAGLVERVIDVLRDELCSTDHPVSDWERETARKIVAELTQPQGDAAEIAALRERVRELEEGLKPFVDALEEMRFDRDNRGNPFPDSGPCGWIYVTLGDFMTVWPWVRLGDTCGDWELTQ